MRAVPVILMSSDYSVRSTKTPDFKACFTRALGKHPPIAQTTFAA